MADNTHFYGFQWDNGANGRECPNPVTRVVATGYQATNDGAGFSVDLNAGDPVKLVSDGTVALANTGDAVWGIIIGFNPYWDGTRMVPTKKLPGGTAWGTVEPRRSEVLVVPVDHGQVWRLDCDDKTTATTEAAYRAFVGENVTVDCPGDNSDTSNPKADPIIDISDHATTASLVWRIEGISQTLENKDFSGLYVKLLLKINKAQSAGWPATTIAGV